MISKQKQQEFTKAVEKLYKPYQEHYMGFDNFTIEIGGKEDDLDT